MVEDRITYGRWYRTWISYSTISTFHKLKVIVTNSCKIGTCTQDINFSFSNSVMEFIWVSTAHSSRSEKTAHLVVTNGLFGSTATYSNLGFQRPALFINISYGYVYIDTVCAIEDSFQRIVYAIHSFYEFNIYKNTFVILFVRI